MSDEYDELDDLDNEAGSDLVKDLRKQLKAAKKENADLVSIANEFKATQRKQTVAEKLKAKGADPRYAEFYTGEDSSEEAVTAWIESKADLFGIDTSDTGADEATQRAAAAISQASLNASPPELGTPAAFAERMKAAQTPEEFQRVLAQAAAARASAPR